MYSVKLSGGMRWTRVWGCVVGCVLFLTVSASGLPSKTDPLSGFALYKDLRTYTQIAEHLTGTNGAYDTSKWIKDTLDQAGYQTSYDNWNMRQFYLRSTGLIVDGAKVECFPMWYPKDTGKEPVKANLAYLEPGAKTSLDGKIAFVKSKFVNMEKEKVLDLAVKGGAVALIMSVDTPSGEMAAMTPWPQYSTRPLPIPTVLIGKKDEFSLILAAKKGLNAQLHISGRTIPTARGRNIVARLVRGPKVVVVSTSYTGWFRCGGEHGTSVAMFLGLAKWAAQRKTGPSYLFVAFAGSELGGTGFRRYMLGSAPDPKNVLCWVHIGPSAAARQWDKKPEVSVPLQELSSGVKLECHPSLNPVLGKTFNKVFKLVPRPPVEGTIVQQLVERKYRAFGLGGDHYYLGTKLDSQTTTSPMFLVPLTQAITKTLIAIE